MAAVQIHGTGFLAVTGSLGRIRACIRMRVRINTVAGIIVVLVAVMTEVLHANLGLMPTVRRHRPPAELERQEGE